MIFLVALRKEWMEQWRRSRFVVLGAVLLIFGLTSPLIAKYTPEIIAMVPETEDMADLIPEPTAMSAVTQYVQNISQFGVILALLLTMGAVAREKNRGTASLMLVKPLPRSVFLLAKFLMLALMFAITIAAAGAASYYYTWVLFDALDVLNWLALNGLMLVFLLVYVALTLFCSVLTRSQAAAGGMALGLLFLLGLIGSIPRVGEFLPGQLIAWGQALMAGEGGSFWPALAVSGGIILVALAGSILIFERQEL